MLTELKKLASDFSTQPLAVGREMRDLLEQSPSAFCAAAIDILAGQDAERVKRYLVALLWTNNLLIACLTDPATPQEMAGRIADLARKVDPQLPAKLVGFVLERTEVESPQCLERILALLKAMPDAAGFRPLLTPLLRHPNARIRSKVALLAGEGNRNRTWFERRMLEEDPRVRANAIESAGQRVTEELRPLFQTAALDSNNRVVGNALIALYRLGDAMSVANLYDLISHPETAFRATAVWAMGETGDTRFLPVLARILTDPNQNIKATTFRAIRKLRRRDHTNANRLNVRVLSDSISSGAELNVVFGVLNGIKPVTGILATQVQLLVNGEHVYRYSLIEQESSRRISAGFLLPRIDDRSSELWQRNREALERCVQQRRGGDNWLISQHTGATGVVGGTSRPEVLFGVRMNPVDSTHVAPLTSGTDLRTVFDAPEISNRTDFTTAFLTLTQELRASRFSGHLFLLQPETACPVDAGQLTRAAQEARITVHAVCRIQEEQFRDICEVTGGFFCVSEDPASSLLAIYRGLSHRYQATAAYGGDVRRLQVVVRSADAFGESPPVEPVYGSGEKSLGQISS